MPPPPKDPISSPRDLPRVDDLLEGDDLASLRETAGRTLLREAIRTGLDWTRGAVEREPVPRSALLEKIRAGISARLDPVLRPVVNATGVLLHTNLGRAPLAPHVMEHVSRTVCQPCTLEYDLRSGRRGARGSGVAAQLAALTGAEDAIAVNNNAAAVLLALQACCAPGEVLVSRGELVEIGGSFRMPDVMALSGCRLVEVGTTNRTRVSDYRDALGRRTRGILRVHRGNFAVEGFAGSAPLEEVAEVAREASVPLLVDLGHGAMEPLGMPGGDGLPETVRGCLLSGADLVLASGDKLLGGPQAGLAVGRRKLLRAMRRHPLQRALRADKLCLAALEAVLRDHATGRRDRIPALRAIREEPGAVRARAETARASVAERLEAAGFALELLPVLSAVGGGSDPRFTLPSFALSVAHPAASSEQLAERLRAGTPPVVGRIQEDRLLLDLRTVQPEQIEAFANALNALALV